MKGALSGKSIDGLKIDPVTEARFWSFVKIDFSPQACWLWTGSDISQAGYPRMKNGIKRISATRLSYAIFNGYVPAGLVVCHHCDNPTCVRPDHLFLGSHADNMLDKYNKGRHAHGANVGTSILDAEQVLQIDSHLARGESLNMIAKMFNISKKSVINIKHRKTWKHLFPKGGCYVSQCHR